MTKASKQTHPFFRRGTPEFARALKLGTDRERAIWLRFGIVQFTPTDPRVARVTMDAPAPTVRGKLAASGDA